MLQRPVGSWPASPCWCLCRSRHDFVSAATAVAVSNKRASLLAAAAAVFLVNAGYGAWRMSAPAQGAAVQSGADSFTPARSLPL